MRILDTAPVLRWCTHFGSGNQYTDHSDTFMSGTRFWSWFDANTVQTFEVDHVNL
jgi:galactan endo-1,6-beta-galactosidase